MENVNKQNNANSRQACAELTVISVSKCTRGLTCLIHSYFEKGCRKKCTRRSRKVWWVVLCSLKFFEEIWKNGPRGHGRMFASAKGNSKSRFDSYSVGNSVLIISHITFLDFRVPLFSENLSRNSCIRPRRWRAARSKKQTVTSSGFSPALHREVVVSQPRLHLFVPNINSHRAFSRHVKFRFPFVTCIFQWIICVHSGQFSLLSQNSIMH